MPSCPRARSRDNLLYGLKHAPLDTLTYEGDRGDPAQLGRPRGASSPAIRTTTSTATGSTTRPPARPARRICSPSSATCSTPSSCRATSSTSALRSSAEPARHSRAGRAHRRIARGAARTAGEGGCSADLVVPFEPGAYNSEATVGENLLVRRGHRSRARRQGARGQPLFRLGAQGSRPRRDRSTAWAWRSPNRRSSCSRPAAGSPVLPAARLHDAGRDTRPTMRCCRSSRAGRIDSVSEEDRAPIITLSFAYIEPRHRFGLLTEELMDKIVEARDAVLRASAARS